VVIQTYRNARGVSLDTIVPPRRVSRRRAPAPAPRFNAGDLNLGLWSGFS